MTRSEWRSKTAVRQRNIKREETSCMLPRNAAVSEVMAVRKKGSARRADVWKLSNDSFHIQLELELDGPLVERRGERRAR